MAWIDYYKQVEEQLAMLLAGTTEGGAAIPGVAGGQGPGAGATDHRPGGAPG